MKQKRKSRAWIKPCSENRSCISAFNDIFGKLKVNDNEKFRRYLRISTASYQKRFV